MKKGRTTIYHIAEELNITAATVSRALNNNPKISQATRKLVLETARRMNYRQNKLALALKSGKSNNVGVIVPQIDRNFFASVIHGIEERLYSEGYHVIICQSYDNEKLEIENIDALLNAQVDGIFMSIFVASPEKDEAINRILKKGVPLIFFDRNRNIEGVSSVLINDFDGGYKATQHLIEQGCTKIAHFVVDKSLDIYDQRFKGYQKALEEYNIPFIEEYVVSVRSKVEDGEAAAQHLLNLKQPPDAIFSSSDFAALGAIRELKTQGIRIPEDFCIVGFSNEPFTKFMELSISTIDQSPLKMGNLAANIFVEQTNQSKNFIEQKIILEPKLLVRSSSNRSPDA